MNLSLIVTDSGPLITLAVAGSLDVLLLPGLPVIVPEGIHALEVGESGNKDQESW